MTKWFLVALALAIPAVQGHASPDPLDVDVHLHADDTDDAYAYYDGFDLQDLYVREAFVEGQGGLIFRMVVYGGFATGGTAAQMHLDVTVGTAKGDRMFRISSSDGSAWNGDLLVVETALEPITEGGVEGSLQAFASYQQLGVGIGDTVGPFIWANYADDDLRDISPGGRPIPGTNGDVMAGSEGQVKADSLTLEGPVGYTRTSMEKTADTVELLVENRISTIGQHIMLFVPKTAGWSVDGPEVDGVGVEPGHHPEFSFTAIGEPGSRMLHVEVRTDLGGQEIVMIEAPEVGEAATRSTPGGAEESPGLAAALLLVGMLFVARRFTR